MTEYCDMDGKPTTLHRLCCSDPTWAASRIETDEQQIERLRAVSDAADHLWRQLHNIKTATPRWANDSVCEAMVKLGDALNSDQTRQCQCKACLADGPHDSDCSVHNEPAYPNGPCDCSLADDAIQKPLPTIAEVRGILSDDPARRPKPADSSRILDTVDETMKGLEDCGAADSRLSKLHPDCRGPWERGDTSYPTGEHIRDCDKCLEWNRHPDRHSAGEVHTSTCTVWDKMDCGTPFVRHDWPCSCGFATAEQGQSE